MISVNKKSVAWSNPNQMNLEEYKDIINGDYNGEILITGIEKDSMGKIIYKSLDDLIRNPYCHGLMAVIEVASHLYNHIKTLNTIRGDNCLPPLSIRFSSSILEAFEGNYNPTVWIHLGHGILEHNIAKIAGGHDIESIPGISDGDNTDSILCTRKLAQIIQQKEGQILFLGLPICFAHQISKDFLKSDAIQMIHAPTDFLVDSRLEFYDGSSNDERLSKEMNEWFEWVRISESLQKPMLLDLFQTRGDE